MSLRGLYAITSEALCRDHQTMPEAVRAAIRGGAVLVQYRDKWNPPARRFALARELATLCHGAGAKLVINDDPHLAMDSGADGVHLGASDAQLAAARAQLGPRALIGVTCGNRIERALDAQAGGAGYVSFGRFFDSRTKPDAPAAPPDLLQGIGGRIHVPICVIGGLTPDNAAPLVNDGASLVAVVGGVFGAIDVEAAARRYSALFGPR